MRIAILKVGEWNGKSITKDFLQQLVDNYDPLFFYAPVVVTHKENDKPLDEAVGWVESLELDGDILYANIDPTPKFFELVKLGKYRNVSPEVYPNLMDKGPYLRRVSLLGADVPAQKGLPPIKLAERYKSFAVTNLPIAPEDTPWDADAAKKRIRDKYGWEGLAKYCCAVDMTGVEDGYPENLNAYKFPFADIVQGKVQIVPKAVSTGLAFLHGARGVRVDHELAALVEPILNELREKIEKKEEKMAEDKEKLQKLQEEIESLKKEKEQLADLIARTEAEKEILKFVQSRAYLDKVMPQLVELYVKDKDNLIKVLDVLPKGDELQKLSLFREIYDNGKNESDKDKALKLYGVSKEA